MNSPVGTKDRPWRARISFRNGESSASLTQGMPVILLSSDPSAVVTPNTGGTAAINNSLFAGLMAENSLPVAQYGDVVIAGYHKAARVLRMTKAASTDIWASFPAIAIGDYFTIESVNNCIQRSGAGAAASDAPRIVALETVSSATTLASDASSDKVPLTATALTHSVKVWVRGLG